MRERSPSDVPVALRTPTVLLCLEGTKPRWLSCQVANCINNHYPKWFFNSAWLRIERETSDCKQWSKTLYPGSSDDFGQNYGHIFCSHYPSIPFVSSTDVPHKLWKSFFSDMCGSNPVQTLEWLQSWNPIILRPKLWSELKNLALERSHLGYLYLA